MEGTANGFLAEGAVDAVESLVKAQRVKFLFAWSADDKADEFCLKNRMSLLIDEFLPDFGFTPRALLETILLNRPLAHELILFETWHVQTALVAHPNPLGDGLHVEAADVVGVFAAVAEDHACLAVLLAADFAGFLLVDKCGEGKFAFEVLFVF